MNVNVKNYIRVPMATKPARGWTANIPNFRVAKATAPHRHVYTSPHGANFFRPTIGLKVRPDQTIYELVVAT